MGYIKKKDYGITVYVALDDDEKILFENIRKKEARSKSSLATIIIREYLTNCSRIDNHSEKDDSKDYN